MNKEAVLIVRDVRCSGPFSVLHGRIYGWSEGTIPLPFSVKFCISFKELSVKETVPR